MKHKVVRGKCPKCLPEGGACLTLYSTEKVCNNCGHPQPRRYNKPSGKPTPSQLRTLTQMLNNGRLTAPILKKQEMIGRKLWFEIAEPDTVNFLIRRTLYGTIGPAGAVKGDYDCVGCHRKFTDPVYLI